MSNIGKKPITIENGVILEVSDSQVVVVGPKGTQVVKIPSGVNVSINDGVVKIGKKEDNDELEKFTGLARSLIFNAMSGVVVPFTKKLELIGVGYRARVDGGNLVLNVGFATPVTIKAPDEIAFSVNDNIISVTGISKQLVGDVASNIRKVRVPDPYKGKGIKYQNEHIRRKAGKSAKTAGTK